MIDIQLYTNENVLSIPNKVDITSNSVNSFNVTVNFDETWDGYTNKRVAFYTDFDKTVYTMYLATGNSCKIPAETLVKTGKLFVGVIGTKEDGTKLTSTVLEFTIKLGASDGEDTEIVLTPTVVDSLIERINNKAVTFNATVGTNWTQSGDGFIQKISVRGLLSTDYPIIGVRLSEVSNKSEVKDQWNRILWITTNDNELVVTSSIKTTIPIPIIVKAVR